MLHAQKKCKTTQLLCLFHLCRPLLSKRLNCLIKRTYIIMIIMVLIVPTDEIREVVVGVVINGWGEISRTGGHRRVIMLHWPLNWRLWWVDFSGNSSISTSNSTFIGQFMKNSYTQACLWTTSNWICIICFPSKSISSHTQNDVWEKYIGAVNACSYTMAIYQF